MLKKIFVVSIVTGLFVVGGQAFAQSQTEKEILQVISQNYTYIRTNLKAEPNTYSKEGALEFWSSGGLMQEIKMGARPEEYEYFRISPRHVRVITLVEGQAAVVLFYSEGAMKPKGSPAVDHYLTRVMQVFVKEDGKWKTRASHWSPLLGGSGTSQVTQ